jgi:hypothetical protein
MKKVLRKYDGAEEREREREREAGGGKFTNSKAL